MTHKHAQGEWIYSMGGTFDVPSVKVKTEYGLLTIANCDTSSLRIAAHIQNVELPDEFDANMDEANARLIAAAPDLLKAAEYAIECLLKMGNIGDFGDQALQSLESAIKKATQQ